MKYLSVIKKVLTISGTFIAGCIMTDILVSSKYKKELDADISGTLGIIVDNEHVQDMMFHIPAEKFDNLKHNQVIKLKVQIKKVDYKLKDNDKGSLA